MQQQHHLQEGPPLAFLVLACLVGGSKRATMLHEAVIQTGGFVVEPGTFSRVVARMERQGWIVSYEDGEGSRRYQITHLGMLVLQTHERSLDRQRRKKLMMPLVLWILRLYPQGWRERYEEEMVALLTQHHMTLWTILDLLMGAVDARLDPYYRQAHQLLPLRRFKSSWRLLVASFVAFWFALLPWFWMTQIGLDDANCSNSVWGGNVALCILRKTLGKPQYSAWGLLITLILIFLPILLMLFITMLSVARGKKANIHLGLAQVVTVGMIVICMVCGFWLAGFWQLLPQIGRFYPQTPAGLIIGIIGMGLATVLGQGALVRAAFALRDMEKAAPKEEPATFFAAESGTRKGTKSKWALLVGMVLVFIVPWPGLINGNPFGHSMLMFGWLLAVIVGLITAWLVKEPGKKWEQRARRKPRRATSPMWWAAILPALPITVFICNIGFVSGEWPLLAGIMSALIVSGATALIVKIRMGHFRFKSPLVVSLGVLVLATIFMILPTLFLVNLMSIVPAFFVRVPDRKPPVEGESPPQDIGAGAAPKVVGWVLFLLVGNALYARTSPALYLNQGLYPLPPWAGWNAMFLSLVMVICLIPALELKIQNSNRWAAGVREPAQNDLSPKVWILVLPVVFLTFVRQIASIFAPNSWSFADVFISWLLTGIAALIILLAFKFGSRKRRTTPEPDLQEAHMQVQS